MENSFLRFQSDLLKTKIKFRSVSVNITKESNTEHHF